MSTCTRHQQENIRIGNVLDAPRAVAGRTSPLQIANPVLLIPFILVNLSYSSSTNSQPRSPHLLIGLTVRSTYTYIRRSPPCRATTTRTIWRSKRSGLLLKRMDGSILAATTQNSRLFNRRDLQFRLQQYSIWRLSTQLCYAHDIPTSLLCPLILCCRSRCISPTGLEHGFAVLCNLDERPNPRLFGRRCCCHDHAVIVLVTISTTHRLFTSPPVVPADMRPRRVVVIV